LRSLAATQAFSACSTPPRLFLWSEFFFALGEVIGHTHADDMLSALSSRNRLQDAPQEALMDLAKNLQTLPFIGALKLFGG